MENKIIGKAHVFGDNIDTDQIYPGRFLELVKPHEIAKHCMVGAKEDFLDNFTKGDLIIGGTNFGCGSSREHAVITLKSAGVGAVVAKSFARIFYRNAFNLGLPLVACKDLDKLDIANHTVTLDLEKSTLTDDVTGVSVLCEPISEYAMELLTFGGIKNLIKERYK